MDNVEVTLAGVRDRTTLHSPRAALQMNHRQEVRVQHVPVSRIRSFVLGKYGSVVAGKGRHSECSTNLTQTSHTVTFALLCREVRRALPVQHTHVTRSCSRLDTPNLV